MSVRKPTARERLVAHVRPDREAIPPEDDQRYMANFHRLLRAHERELAERAAKAAADMCSKAYDAGNNDLWFYYGTAREHVRASILGTKARP